MQVCGAYTYQPMFAQMLGLGAANFVVNSSSVSGIPTIDLELLVDIGDTQGQMTPISFVQRYWDALPFDGSPPHIVYMVPTNGSGSAQGPLSQAVGEPYANVLPVPPQSLDWSTYDLTTCMNFSEVIGTPPGTGGTTLWDTFVIGPSETCTTSKSALLRGFANPGAPPGNYIYNSSTPIPPYVPGPGTPTMAIAGYNYDGFYFAGGSKSSGNAVLPNLSTVPTAPNYAGNLANGSAGACQSGPINSSAVYTDLVVNLDGNNQFSSTTVTTGGGTFNFPSAGSLVEASRGNLESDALAYQSALI